MGRMSKALQREKKESNPMKIWGLTTSGGKNTCKGWEAHSNLEGGAVQRPGNTEAWHKHRHLQKFNCCNKGLLLVVLKRKRSKIGE